MCGSRRKCLVRLCTLGIVDFVASILRYARIIDVALLTVRVDINQEVKMLVPPESCSVL